MVRAPVSDQEVTVLKALVLCLCAFSLLTLAVTRASRETAVAAPAATSKPRAAEPTAKERARTARRHLAHKLAAARRYRRTIVRYEARRSLLRSGEKGSDARANLRRARRGLARTTREIVYYRGLVQRWETLQRAQRLRSAPPRAAICGVFGRYCAQAVAVAWCESRLSPAAQNGQYLGLFQMGSSERRLFGHGATPYQQALAAHRYFVHSGRDWSPWSCRWAAY